MEKIREVRQEKTKIAFEELKAWAKEMSTKAPPKSLTGKAIACLLGQLPKLGYLINDPIVGPDTNVVENAITPFAVGRKNWLFRDTARGADASLNLFSFVITARANGIEPYNY